MENKKSQPMFASVAESLGIRGIHHLGYEDTRKKLESFGLKSKG